ncbi:hypothetical protein [Candidatus Cryosericum septentrionale]|jgi:hypothetical protein|uniref:Uncharacterized protein n=1 Tax=Candidatus Cryosericum septentrionale TaxID=2290913 RepID=A0A398DMQ6_9BACT|nr:hypothetical protein [Candidatus Cryosericum septentrionale]RIE16230.1 hypothetical protein SMC1_07935 [Candidatus Cryosericum septentrionale]
MRPLRVRRSGFALLSVILVGALLLTSALMFLSQLAAESSITRSDASFKTALNVAETGINNVVSDVNYGHPTTWGELLWDQIVSVDPVTKVATVTGVAQTVGPVDVPRGSHGTYTVAVKVKAATAETTDTATQTVTVYSGTLQLTGTGAVFPPAVTDMTGAGSALFSTRRGILTETNAIWSKTVTKSVTTTQSVTPSTFLINYGILAGGDLTISGSSNATGGDVFTNGLILLEKAASVASPYKAYTVVGPQTKPNGQVIGNFPTDRLTSGVAPIEFPALNLDYYRTMYDAYIRGLYPYNKINTNLIPGTGGTTGIPPQYYPCTDPVILGTQYYILGVDKLAAKSVEGSLVLKNADGTTRKALELPGSELPAVAAFLTEKTAVYFVSGNATFQGGSISGSLVVNGDLRLTGNVAMSSGGGLPTVVVTGIVERDAGCGQMTGLFYVGGFVGDAQHPLSAYQAKDAGLSFTGNGSPNFTGALLARGGVELSGDWNLARDASLTSLVTGGTVVQNVTTTILGTAYDVSKLQLPPANQRVWKEVNP